MKTSEYAKIPTKGTNLSTGYDLYAAHGATLEPGDYARISTDLIFDLSDLPPTVEVQIRPRSGLAALHGITVLNAPGTIDKDYRGVVTVILINHGKKPYTIEPGDKIAQMVFGLHLSELTMFPVEDINTATERGIGGFNSTGYR